MIKINYRFHELEVSQETYDIWEVSKVFHFSDFEDERNHVFTDIKGYLGFGNSETGKLNGKYRKILNGPSGLKNKFLPVWFDKEYYVYENDNPISLGVFKENAFFLSEKEALEQQRSWMYLAIGNSQSKIHKIYNKLDVIEKKEKNEKSLAIKAYLSTKEVAESFYNYKPLEKNGKIAFYQDDMLNEFTRKRNDYLLEFRGGRRIGKDYMLALSLLTLSQQVDNKEILVICPNKKKVECLIELLNSISYNDHSFYFNYAVPHLYLDNDNEIYLLDLSFDNIKEYFSENFCKNVNYLFVDDYDFYSCYDSNSNLDNSYFKFIELCEEAIISLIGTPVNNKILNAYMEELRKILPVKTVTVPSHWNPTLDENDIKNLKQELSADDYKS